MGKVKDVYVEYGAARDLHVGRDVASLPVLSADYACSPPIFHLKPYICLEGEENE